MSRRLVGFERNGILRYCDLCGGRYRSTELVRGADNLFRCLALCAPETTLIEVAQKEAAAHYKHEAPPPPFGQSYGWSQTWPEEGVFFNMLTSTPAKSPFTSGTLTDSISATAVFLSGHASTDANENTPPSFPSGVFQVYAAAETVHYLCNLIAQGKRPQWTAVATAKVKALADRLSTRQVQLTSFPGVSGSYIFGPFAERIGVLTTYMMQEARIGHAVLKAYLLLGKSEYLASAQLSMRYLANSQRVDLLTTGYSTLGTNRNFFGPPPYSHGFFTLDYSLVMTPDTSFAMLAFQKDLLATSGDGLYGDNLSGLYISNPATLLSESMAAIRVFWRNGAYDTVVGATINGFSSATPWNSYLGSGGQWVNSGTLSMSSWARALLWLYDYEGAGAQGTDVYRLLMASASNPSFATTVDAYLPPAAESSFGAYVPATALATTITAAPNTNQNSSPFVMPWTLGCLAPYHAAYNAKALDDAKQALVMGDLYDQSNAAAGSFVPGMWYQLGLGLQQYGQQANAPVDGAPFEVAKLALFANCFRYGQSYGGIQ